jgi:C1A family cysteine protease
MNNYKLNLKQSPNDERDYIVQIDIDFPDTLDHRPKLEKVRNQGDQGSCFAFAVACMKEYQEKVDYKFEGYMSPQFFYDNRSNMYDSDKHNDEGMYGRDVMKLLKTVGICTEKEYPYGVKNSKHKDNIDSKIYESAKKHVCKSYGQVYSVDELKRSLYVNGPALVCMPVYNFGPEMWNKENSEQEFLGGHAMCIVGYTKDAFIIRNSWGEEWEDKGYCYYPFEQFGKHWEIWTTVDFKNVITEPDLPVINQEWVEFVENIDFYIYSFGFCCLGLGLWFII